MWFGIYCLYHHPTARSIQCLFISWNTSIKYIKYFVYLLKGKRKHVISFRIMLMSSLCIYRPKLWCEYQLSICKCLPSYILSTFVYQLSVSITHTIYYLFFCKYVTCVCVPKLPPRDIIYKWPPTVYSNHNLLCLFFYIKFVCVFSSTWCSVTRASLCYHMYPRAFALWACWHFLTSII